MLLRKGRPTTSVEDADFHQHDGLYGIILQGVIENLIWNLPRKLLRV